MGNDKNNKTAQEIGLLYPFAAFFDPITGFRGDVYSQYLQAMKAITVEQTKKQSYQPWRKNSSTGSKYIF